jgi:hypothetical protein
MVIDHLAETDIILAMRIFCVHVRPTRAEIGRHMAEILPDLFSGARKSGTDINVKFEPIARDNC